jgi:TonB family protein
VRTTEEVDPSLHWYLELLTARLAASWVRPVIGTLAGDQTCEVGFHIARDGRVTAARITAPSQDPRVDASALEAVTRLASFRPLPERLGGPGGEEFFITFVLRGVGR